MTNFAINNFQIISGDEVQFDNTRYTIGMILYPSDTERINNAAQANADKFPLREVIFLFNGRERARENVRIISEDNTLEFFINGFQVNCTAVS